MQEVFLAGLGTKFISFGPLMQVTSDMCFSAPLTSQSCSNSVALMSMLRLYHYRPHQHGGNAIASVHPSSRLFVLYIPVF